MRWFRRLQSGNQTDTSQKVRLAAADGKGIQNKPMSEPASIPVPGDVIEDYEILEKIGGNMGLVFKARHRLLNKVVALKLLPAEWMADSRRLERFQREIRVLGQLEHPNLVTAADARRMDSWYFVTMEWIEGLDLQQLARAHGTLPINVACEAARQAALGLQFAHEHGLIHRDIKPSNLMLSVTGIIKVIDMGLALANEDTSAELTQTGQVMGTMSYCAPEQFRDASGVDTRADIYSLGCTLYHLIAGKAPYGHRKSITEVMQAHLNEPFPNLREARPDAPEDLEALLKRMTEKDPNARLSTPGAVAEVLERFATGANLKPFVPTNAGQKTPAQFHPGKTPQPLQKPRQADEPERRLKLPWLKLAASFVVLIAILGTAALFLSPRKPVLVLMDTTAPKGVYDEENRVNGRSNARELNKVLETPELPPLSLNPEPLYAGWDREHQVITKRPDLVIIHRSSFHHSYNAVFDFGSTNEFKHPADDPKWAFLYEVIGDDKLITLLGTIGNEVPHTRFLVYSRGTDTNWLRDDFRVEWIRKIETRYPKLKKRIATIVIPNGYTGTFRDPKTAAELRRRIREILKLPEMRKPEKRN